MRAVAAVLLDMDGTLVDSDAAVARAWTTWARECGVDPAEPDRIAHGRPAASTVRLLRPDLDEHAVAVAADRQLALQYTDLSDVTAARGASDLLAVLDRTATPWAVVTSADRPLATARLGAAGIEPPVLVTVSDVTRGKPDPEPFLLGASRVGAAPRDCLVVEDSPAGLESGRAAGMMTAALRGHEGDLQPADLGDLARFLDAQASSRR